VVPKKAFYFTIGAYTVGYIQEPAMIYILVFICMSCFVI